ncbi:MAG: hypothetical protein NTU49_01750, partial [Gammaproteobacteria bacterium]|nr:hypothetical protein [Gammaproteobacteria bacterium]
MRNSQDDLLRLEDSLNQEKTAGPHVPVSSPSEDLLNQQQVVVLPAVVAIEESEDESDEEFDEESDEDEDE